MRAHRHRRSPTPKTSNRSSGRGEPVDWSCRVRGQGGNHNNTDRIRLLAKTDAHPPRRAAAEFAATEAAVDDPEMPWTSSSSAATAAWGRAQAKAVAVIAPAENAGFVQHLRAHNGAPDKFAAACIDMSPAFIKGVSRRLGGRARRGASIRWNSDDSV
jgi:hypothetical protein